jgi:hypothetical protein
VSNEFVKIMLAILLNPHLQERALGGPSRPILLRAVQRGRGVKTGLKISR